MEEKNEGTFGLLTFDSNEFDSFKNDITILLTKK